MPNIKSAKKRAKTSQARTLQNQMVKSELKTAIRKFNTTLQDKGFEDAQALCPNVVKTIDMAAAKGVIHKNAANRKKAKLALRLNTATAAAQK